MPAREADMTGDESFDLEIRALYAIAESVMPEIDDSAARGPDGHVLGVVFYGALGARIVEAVERNESLDGLLPTTGAIVEYAAVAVAKEFKRWAPPLSEFFEALDVSPEANAIFARFASERIRAGAARVGYSWAPDQDEAAQRATRDA